MMPRTKVDSQPVSLGGGLDLLSSSQMAKPGSAVRAINYESAFGGGWARIGGIEKFSGQPRPSDAEYVLMTSSEVITDIAVGDVVTGLTSGAYGTCVYVSGASVAVTKTSGDFILEEELQVGGTTVATNSGTGSALTASLNNELFALAAQEYADDIAAVTGSGPIRGIAALGSTLYAWRDNAGGTAMVIHKSTSTGWVAVDMLYELSFTIGGGTQPAEGSTITQGGVSATLKRVILEDGTYAGTTAQGRYIISIPVGGSFIAGALAGTLGTVPGAAAGVYHGTQITLSPAGRVVTDQFNFTASADTRRLYGCDGVNREFEFDGTVYCPLTSGQTSKATVVRCHANHLFFGFRGSLQHSGILAPYQFTAVSGGAELGAGDVITGLSTLPGSTERAAMLVTCQNSTFVLYGNAADGTYEWTFIPVNREAGANPYSLEDCGVPLFHDTPGIRSFKAVQEFGNFTWNLESRLVEKIVKERIPVASCFSKALSRYRCFFSDGSTISGTPGRDGVWDWSQIIYGDKDIRIAYSTEVAGITRTFYGDADGYVYEADVGRSFDGDEIEGILRLHGLSQNRPGVDKTYRFMIVETMGEGAFTLYSRAEFNDGSPDRDPSTEYTTLGYGGGALWDESNWDESFWDTRRQDSQRIDIQGYGFNVAPIFRASTSIELPYTIKTVTVFYTARKVRVA